jgi:hypothetical protein
VPHLDARLTRRGREAAARKLAETETKHAAGQRRLRLRSASDDGRGPTCPAAAMIAAGVVEEIALAPFES